MGNFYGKIKGGFKFLHKSLLVPVPPIIFELLILRLLLLVTANNEILHTGKTGLHLGLALLEGRLLIVHLRAAAGKNIYWIHQEIYLGWFQLFFFLNVRLVHDHIRSPLLNATGVNEHGATLLVLLGNAG